MDNLCLLNCVFQKFTYYSPPFQALTHIFYMTITNVIIDY